MTSEPMQLERLDDRFDQHGRIGVRVPYTFTNGYVRTAAEVHIWPDEPLVEHDAETGKVRVNFNVWASKEVAEAVPPLRYSAHPTFPFGWYNHKIHTDITDAKVLHDINHRIVGQPLFPTLLYTPTLFLMLNGVAFGQTPVPDHFVPPVIDSHDLLVAYHQVVYVLKQSSQRTPNALYTILQNYDENLRKLTFKVADQMNNDGDLHEFTVQHLQRVFAQGGHAALEQERGNFRELERFAACLITYQYHYIRLYETLIYALSDAQLDATKLGAPFFVQPALPLAAPEQPLYAVARELAAPPPSAERSNSIAETQFHFLRVKAEQEQCPSLVPPSGRLSEAEMLYGLPTHGLRLLLLIMLHKPDEPAETTAHA